MTRTNSQKKRGKMNNPIFAAWDCEASGLDADWSTWISAGFQRFTYKGGVPVLIDKKPITFRIDKTPEFAKDRTDDSGLAKDVRNFIMGLDVLVGFYSVPFDIRYVQGKLGLHNLEFLPTFGRRHIDLYYSGKKMKLTRGGLANTCEHLGIEGKKTYLNKRIWRRAGAGYSDAIDYVVKHNEADVTLTYNLYKRLAPLVYQHPITGDKELCWCGSGKIRRGPAFTASKTQQYRWSCKGAVAHWSVGAES